MSREYHVEFVVPETAALEAAGDSVEMQIGADEYLLAAARSQGLWLPADCQQGWCTTCGAELLAGEVDQSDARRYYPADERAGLILTCTAKPRSDLRVLVGQHERVLTHRAAHDLPPGNAKR